MYLENFEMRRRPMNLDVIPSDAIGGAVARVLAC